MYYTLKTTTTYRVPTVEDALDLRKYLERTSVGELTAFKYTTKYIKEKGQIVDEYQVVTAKGVNVTVNGESLETAVLERGQKVKIEFDNLFAACRGASFTHIAASSARLTRTMLSLGEGVGEYISELF